MKSSKSLSTALKLLVTAIFLLLVFRSVDISKIQNDLQAFNVWYLIFLLFVSWVGQFICSQRWRLIAATLEIRSSYRSFVQMYFVGMFFNIGLPSIIGGDVIKACILSRKTGRTLPIALSSILQDRTAGLISLFILGSLAILAKPLTWKGFPLWVAYLLFWVIIAIVLWLAVRGERFYRRFLHPERRTLAQKLLQALADLQQSFGSIHLASAVTLQITFYSFLNGVLIIWTFQQVTVVVGHPVDFVYFSALFPLVTMLTALPITIGGLGIREWACIEALSLVGVPPTSGLVISLAMSALLIVTNLGGIFFLPTIPAELRTRIKSLSSSETNPDFTGSGR